MRPCGIATGPLHARRELIDKESLRPSKKEKRRYIKSVFLPFVNGQREPRTAPKVTNFATVAQLVTRPISGVTAFGLLTSAQVLCPPTTTPRALAHSTLARTAPTDCTSPPTTETPPPCDRDHRSPHAQTHTEHTENTHTPRDTHSGSRLGGPLVQRSFPWVHHHTCPGSSSRLQLHHVCSIYFLRPTATMSINECDGRQPSESISRKRAAISLPSTLVPSLLLVCVAVLPSAPEASLHLIHRNATVPILVELRALQLRHLRQLERLCEGSCKGARGCVRV
jgi:hypothetical protein